jgi:hypothetical protein
MKHAVTYTKKFAEDMYKSLGVRYLFLVAMETPSETVHTGVLDFNDAIGGGKTYASQHNNWRREGIDIDYWNDHNRDYYNPNKIPADVSTRKGPRSHLALECNEYGEPVIPDPLLIPRQESARSWRQNVVRAFLSKHYGMWSCSYSSYFLYLIEQNWPRGLQNQSPGRNFYPDFENALMTYSSLMFTGKALPNLQA